MRFFHPEIDSCKITKITQLKAFLRADNSNPIISYNRQSNSGNGKQLGYPIEFNYHGNYLNLTFHYEQNPCEVPASDTDYLQSPRGHAINYLVNEIFEEIINGIQNINSTFFNSKEAIEARKDINKNWKTTVKSTEIKCKVKKVKSNIFLESINFYVFYSTRYPSNRSNFSQE